MWILILQRMGLELLFDIVYFPVWWYTAGARRIFLNLRDLLLFGNAELAPGLWLKNIFVPMFGQHDIQGRFVSFLVRFVNVIGRGIGLLVWFSILIILFLFWIFFPVFIAFMIVHSLIQG